MESKVVVEVKVKEEEQGNIFDTYVGSCCRNRVEFGIVEDDSDTVVVVGGGVAVDDSNDDVDESLFHFL